jgi:trehalose 6-phosphate synthase
VLSEFAGAAIELKESVLVNPHDTDGVKNALYEALTMPEPESRKRMRSLRRQVLGHDVDRWARTFLDSLGLPPADPS